MGHFVYTDTGGRVLGASMAISQDDADRIAVDLENKTGDEITVHNVPAYTPHLVQVGDIITGKTAMTLPKGSAIVRVSTANGLQVQVSGALLRTPGGYRAGITDNDPAGGIDEASRYRVLHLGSPWHPGQGCRS